MTNNIFRIDLLATGGNFVNVTDDGTGIDWLVIQGSYAYTTDIRLNYSFNSTASDASGKYSTYSVATGYQTNTLVVSGVIENVRGCDTADFIVGNEVANLIYGDQDRTGVGGNDTLNGADGKDKLFGGVGSDYLYGGAGNDTIYGDAGNDSITGDAGADTVEGGTGADTVSGGATAGDTVAYTASTAGVSISLTHGTATAGHGGDAEGDQISGFLNIIGSAFNDVLIDTVKTTISFGYNDNSFAGGAGNDRFEMGGGNDTAYGGAGNDTMFGEVGGDKLYADDGNDLLNGGPGNDRLYAGAGQDTLLGGTGRDSLTGGIGADQLTGGDQADVFIYTTLSDSTTGLAGRDTIADFKQVQADKIDLHLIDANTATGAIDDAFSFINTSAFTLNVAGQLHYRTVTGGIVVEGDTNGDTHADFAIFLSGISSVVLGDFTL